MNSTPSYLIINFNDNSSKSDISELTKTNIPLKALGITLLILGILLIVFGILAPVLLGHPLICLIIIFPMLFLVPLGILLIKKSQTTNWNAESGIKTPPEQISPASSILSFSSLSALSIPSSPLVTTTPQLIIPQQIPLDTEEHFIFSKEAILEFLQRHFIQIPDPRLSPNQKMFIRTGLTFIYSVSRIERPAIQLPVLKYNTERGVVFNVSNPRVSREGGGTIRLLAESVTFDSWRSSAPRNGTKLKATQVSLGYWSSSLEYQSKYGSASENTWTSLGQLIGPKIQALTNNLSICYGLFKKTYINAIRASIERQCPFIQLPPLSYGFGVQNPKIRKLIPSMVFMAFLEAAVLISCERKNLKSSTLVLSFVDYKDVD